MADEPKTKLRLEIAHVPFIDIVGYSKLLITEQGELLRALTEVVRETETFRRADRESKLMRIPTGDGMALVFRDSPESPTQCALEISRKLKAHPKLIVRMGIHSGPVNEVVDVSERTNVTGAGINIAQRVMDCGDAGHILLSKHVADDLEQYPDWRPMLHDLGECEVKHGVRVHVVNLYTDELGNPKAPAKFHDQAAEKSQPARSPCLRRWIIGIVLGALVVIGGLALFRREGGGGKPITAEDKTSSSGTTAAIPEKSIAVLPFENLSHDLENAYFADGIQEEILTRLAKIADLKVISRTSTARYKSAPANLRDLGQQLRVAHLLEGSVQRAGDQVRVNVQLIKAADDTHIWAETYDRKLSDIFVVESDVARSIADSLRANLSLSERARVETKPTANTAAYDLYLQARTYHRRGLANLVKEDFDNARQCYERALQADPGFALVHAQLATCIGALFHWFEPTEANKGTMRNEAETALQLDPGLAEAHRARGFWFYWCEHDYDAALADFEIARQAAPNDFDIVGDITAIRRRQGRWDEALAGFEQVAKLDPQNAANASELTFTFSFMRRWPEAAASAKRAIILAPDFLNLRIRAAYVEFWWKDDTGALRQLVESLSPDEDPDGLLTLARWDLALLEHDYAAAEQALNACKLNTIVPYGTPLPIDYLRGCTELARNNFAAAQPLLEKTRLFFEAQVQAIPDDPFRLATLALVYSYLGRNEEAIRFARKATALMPESHDAILGPSYQANLAIVLGRAGAKDEAINLLTRALTLPTGTSATETNITVPDLRRRWQWDPLRGDPRFANLIASPTPK